MNDQILLTFISGDGNEQNGNIHVCMKKFNLKENTPILSIKADDIELLNDIIYKYENLSKIYKNKIPVSLHIDAIKELIEKTRPHMFSNDILNNFNSNNEEKLFLILAELGNIIIQNSDYASIVYLPKYLDDNQIKSIKCMKSFFSDRFFIIKKIMNKEDNKINITECTNVDEFMNLFKDKIK